MAVAFADDLKESEEESVRRQARIIALEALLGDGDAKQTTTVQDIWVPHRTGAMRVPVQEIVMLKAEREYVRLRLIDRREFLIRTALHRMMARLDPGMFVRVHRSTAVNRRHILQISRLGNRGATLTLTGGAETTVSRRLVGALRQIQPSA